MPLLDDSPPEQPPKDGDILDGDTRPVFHAMGGGRRLFGFDAGEDNGEPPLSESEAKKDCNAMD
jgi:hypothetical protein